MNNHETVPGYKYYSVRNSTERPEYVTFLNITKSHPHDRIYGILFSIDNSLLSQLDARERNYQRVDVSKHIDFDLSGGVWIYTGLDDALERFQRGLQHGSACIPQSYHQFVLDSYATLGSHALHEFMQSTDTPQVPIRDLVRHDVP